MSSNFHWISLNFSKINQFQYISYRNLDLFPVNYVFFSKKFFELQCKSTLIGWEKLKLMLTQSSSAGAGTELGNKACMSVYLWVCLLAKSNKSSY